MHWNELTNSSQLNENWLMNEITLAMKMPKPRSNPPRMEKWRISSRDGRVNVTVRLRAFAALAKFNIRNCYNASNTIHFIKFITLYSSNWIKLIKLNQFNYLINWITFNQFNWITFNQFNCIKSIQFHHIIFIKLINLFNSTI